MATLIISLLFLNHVHSGNICDIVSCDPGYECVLENNFAICERIPKPQAMVKSSNLDDISPPEGTSNYNAGVEASNMDVSQCLLQCNDNHNPYCCLSNTYLNRCIADCYGITNIHRDCTKGICPTYISNNPMISGTVRIADYVEENIIVGAKEIDTEIICAPGCWRRSGKCYCDDDNGGNKANANTNNNNLINKCDIKCELEDSDPYCCSGINYDNICLATCYNVTDIDECNQGPCPVSGIAELLRAAVECACEINWHPLCCNDIDYNNPCEARCDDIQSPLLDCKYGTCESQNCGCNSILDPYCCDGKDFDSPCIANCNGFTDINNECKKGRCESICICSNMFEPYCCGSKTYANPCKAKCDAYDILTDPSCNIGTCESIDCGCPYDESEAICCDGDNYLNPCDAECNGITAPAQEQDECFMGICEDLCICSQEYNPICCDGKDFSNQCVAKCNGIFNTDLCLSGSCDNQGDCECIREYEPLCCSGETFSNTCYAECNGIEHPVKLQPECELGVCNICTCDTIYSPMCCEGIDFDNECIAHCAINANDTTTSCLSGTCEELRQCSLEYNPVCCDKGREQITYSNQCLADKDTGCIIVTTGICEIDKCECDRSYNPYCCQTKLGQRQFDNICIAECNDIINVENVCEVGLCDNQPCGCIMEYEPLCCNDITYYNPCNAQCYGIPIDQQQNCQLGTCVEQQPPIGCACDNTYDPYCCNGNDFLNICEIGCHGISLTECKIGTCKNQFHCICTHEYNPICCNGKDFVNQCVASCSGNIINSKTCSSGICNQQNGCLCEREYQPLCCNDKNYSNACMAQCDGIPYPATIYCLAGICIHPIITTTAIPIITSTIPPITTTDCISLCIAIYDPWCCNDTIYLNECEAKCDDFCDPGHDIRCYKGNCTLTTTIQPETSAKSSTTNIPIFTSTLAAISTTLAAIITSTTTASTTDVSTSTTQTETETETTISTIDMCHCPLILAPVCCEGRQYDNECLAECHSHVYDVTKQCINGECEECNDNYEPVCCEDEFEIKTTYCNLCIAQQHNGMNCINGICDECNCSDLYDPQCCDGITYNNKCEAECDGIEQVEIICDCGECKIDIECENEYEPYCCNGKTYNNLCEAKLDGIVKIEKKCVIGECNVRGNVDGFVSVKYWNYSNKIWMQIFIVALICFGIGLVLPLCCKKKNLIQ